MAVKRTVTIQCDKCGRVLQYGNFYKVTHKNYLAGKLSVLFPNWDRPEEYDLCYECNRKLKDWFDGPTDGRREEEPWK